MKFIRTLLLAILCCFALNAGAGERAYRVVFHVTDAGMATQTLNNVRNTLKAMPNAQVVVVTNGPGIDFLLDGATNASGNPYDATVQDLATHHNVQFRVCNNTLEARHIDKKRVVPEAAIVPSGVVEAARLQLEEGYAYIKP